MGVECASGGCEAGDGAVNCDPQAVGVVIGVLALMFLFVSLILIVVVMKERREQ